MSTPMLILKAIGLLATAVFCAVVISATVFFFVPPTLPVMAATSDTTSMCEPIGVVGTVIISRCIDDETSIILYVNSAGFMILGE